MTNKIYELTDEEFTSLVRESLNVKTVLFKLGYTTKGNSWGYGLVKRRMLELNLTAQDFAGRTAFYKGVEDTQLTKEKIFREGCNHSRSSVRRYILKNNILEYKCNICGISQWNGKTLSLDLDHINGINNDNRIENLRFLCPNCHSQTTTYGSRNQQRNESKYEISEELNSLIVNKYLEIKNTEKVSKLLNIRRIVVSRIVNDNGLSKSNQQFVIRYDSDMNEIERFGSINEACRNIIDREEVKTKLIKTCRNTFLRNKNKFWLGSYWKLLDA